MRHCVVNEFSRRLDDPIFVPVPMVQIRKNVVSQVTTNSSTNSVRSAAPQADDDTAAPSNSRVEKLFSAYYKDDRNRIEIEQLMKENGLKAPSQADTILSTHQKEQEARLTGQTK